MHNITSEPLFYSRSLPYHGHCKSFSLVLPVLALCSSVTYLSTRLPRARELTGTLIAGHNTESWSRYSRRVKRRTAGVLTSCAGKMAKFEPPSWAGKPTPSTLLKVHTSEGSGQHQEDIRLDEKPYYVFGRTKESCDVVLDHGSASRMHAAIVHHENGRYVPRLPEVGKQ